MPVSIRCAYNSAQGAGVNRKAMNFRTLCVLGPLLLGAFGIAHADGLPQAQPVMLPQPALNTLPLVDRVVVHKAERRLILMHSGNIVRTYHGLSASAPSVRRSARAISVLRKEPTVSSAATPAAIISSPSRCPTRTTPISSARARGTGIPAGRS